MFINIALPQLLFSRQSLSRLGSAESLKIIEPSYVPLDDKVTVELQSWVDAFHEMILTMPFHSGKRPEIPRPSVVLNRSPGIGARVLDVDICVNVRVAFPGGTFDGQTSEHNALTMNNCQLPRPKGRSLLEEIPTSSHVDPAKPESK